MTTRRGGGRLGDVKGADALAKLLETLSPGAQPKPRPMPASREDLAAAIARRSRMANPKISQARDLAVKTKLKAKPKKEVIKLPRSAVEEAIRLADEATAWTASPNSAPIVSHDFGAGAYRRVALLRPALERFVADARAPDGVDEMTRITVARLIDLGAAAGETIVDPDVDGYIGHDFGTSSTKAVVRWPYDRTWSAYSVPVPPAWSSGGIPHLWPTIAYLHQSTGRFTLFPESGSLALAGFKSALIEGRGHRMCAGSQATMADAATAFLAMHLAYILGTVVDRQADARISGLNMGVPVAALADQTTHKIFSTIARAAILLLPYAASLTLDDVKVALAIDDRGALPFELHAELAGAIAGYCAGPRPYLGSHMIIDCGSATLDIASFHLESGPWPVAIHAAGVEPLGADACTAYQAVGATEDDCRSAARHHEHQVFSNTLDHARLGFGQDEHRRYPYQVIVVGGGIQGSVHRPLFDGMESAFRRPFHRPALDPALVCEPGANPGRLILADGLARDPIDLRKVAMPGDRQNVSLVEMPEMISKDQV